MSHETNVETIDNGAASGPVASAMMNVYNGVHFDMSSYRKLASLPERAWDYIDDVLIRTAKEELNGVADLNARAQTNVTFDGMSSSVYTRERISEVGSANVAVSPDTSADSGVLAMDSIGIPMVVTYKDFFVNTKKMAMAARVGLPLQTALVEEATRSVSRKLEENLFVGNVRANGSTAYGYTTFPDRQTFTISDWANVATTPEVILGNLISMVSLSMQANHFGPWMLYIPWQYQAKLLEDYTVGAVPVSTNRSIRERLLEITGLEDIKTSQYLPNNNIVLVEMSSSTVQMINAMPMRAVQWEAPGSPNWEHKFKVLTIAVPFLMSDYKGQCGIVHGSV